MHLLEIQNLTKIYEGKKVLDSINLKLEKGTTLGLIGPTGCGKTTLLRIIDLLERPSFGNIFLDGVEISNSKADPKEVRRRIGMVFQKPIVFNGTVYDNIRYGLKVRGEDEESYEKDISTLLKNHEVMRYIVEEFDRRFDPNSVDIIAGAESRGLLFASAYAMHVNKGCVMVSKKGKLPGPTEKIEYALEYGDGILEMQKDSIAPGQRVLLIDDLLATGGTARAATKIIEKLGGTVAGLAFVIELEFLKGREVIGDYNIQTLVSYDY